MNIGFYFESSIRSGGAYQYALNLLEALKANTEHSYTVFNVSPDFPFNDFDLPNWKVINLIPKKEAEGANMLTAHKPTFRRSFNLFVLDLIRKLRLYRLEIFLTMMRSKNRAKIFSGHDIDLMFFHGPSELSFMTEIPSIVPIHDLQHRVYPEFPEVSAKGQRAKREYLYNNIKRRAYKILVDSEIGKEDVMKYYGVEKERIEVVPFLPPSYLRPDVETAEIEAATLKFGLPPKFIFYPAQFWPHKNHRRLISAIRILKDSGANVPLVLVGTKQHLWGELEQVEKQISEEGLEDLVHFLSYVSNDEMSVLYKKATALAMPTFFGPTNIPVTEAWLMGCPVLYSDLRGCREQAGDAALLFDPSEPESIAEKISQIWNDAELRGDLAAKGRQRLGLWTRQDFNDKISRLINSFKTDGK